MDSNPKLWSINIVSQWLQTIALGSYSENFVKNGINGQKLLELNRRTITPLVQNFRDAMKLEFEIKKLQEKMEQEITEKENAEREELVLKKLNEISVKSDNKEISNPEIKKETKIEENKEIENPKEEITQNNTNQQTLQNNNQENQTREINEWTIEEVDEWACKIIGNQFKSCFIKKSIDGCKLIEMSSNQLSDEIKIRGIPLMKLYHEIEKLKEPILKKIQEEKEKKEKTFSKVFKFEGLGDSEQIILERSHHHLTNGIYIHVCESKRDVEIEVENMSSPPVPILLSFSIKNPSNVTFPSLSDTKFILPTQNAINKVDDDPLSKLQHIIGNKSNPNEKQPEVERETKVAKIVPQRIEKEWGAEITVTYQIVNNMEEFIEWENIQKMKEVSLMKELLGEEKEISKIQNILKISKKKFIDPSFPPTNSSLYIDLKDLPKKHFPIQWKRPHQFFKSGKSPKMFTNQISAEDIKQGKLGDCWFLASLSICAHKAPEIILNIIKTKEINEEGIYSFQFFRGETWESVVVDDFFPCSPTSGFSKFDVNQEKISRMLVQMGTNPVFNDGPVYSHNHDEALWVLFLEKAYAKLNSSFQALTSGTLSESLLDLSGSPSLFYFFRFSNDKDKIWEKMMEAQKAGDLMGASTRIETLEEIQEGFKIETYGIVSRHAYGVLDVVQVNNLRLILLQNPWGNVLLWNGDYSKNSSKWTEDLKKKVDYKDISGSFYIEWNDFLKFYNEITVCKYNSVRNWSQKKLRGVYSNEKKYGPQFHLTTSQKTRVLFSIAKKDLRFASGSDNDNRQGLYLLKSEKMLVDEKEIGDKNTNLEFVASSGDWSRREVSFEAELEPNKFYYLIISSQMGNIKFREIPWVMTIFSQNLSSINISQFEVSKPVWMIRSLVSYVNANEDNIDFLKDGIWSIMHFAYYDENRKLIDSLDFCDKVIEYIKKNITDKDLVKECFSFFWNMSCDLEVRGKMKKGGKVLELCDEIQKKFYSNEEVEEVCEVVRRNINHPKNIALDPLIEKCILADACTYTVSGNKTFLLQSWYDCITCNLRSRYGICAVCALQCHAGHELSTPKFSRFFCDCGDGQLKKLGINCKCVKSIEEIGLKKRREKDESYRNLDDDDDPPVVPDPNILPKEKKKKGNFATLFDN